MTSSTTGGPVPAVPAGHEVVDLPVAPSLGLSYLRAVLPGGRPPWDAALPATALRVAGVSADPAHVARYAAVVGAPDGPSLPLLYPYVLGFSLQMGLMTAPAFPFPAIGTVHLAHHVRRLRALPVDGRYDVETWAQGLRPHRLGRVFEIVTVLRSDGLPVWSQTGTFLRRGGTPDAASSGSPGADGSGAADGPQESGPDDDRPLERVATWRLSGGLGRGFAAVSGDRNPIHLHAATARPFGFKRPIAHGMWTAARLVHAVGEGLPAAQVCTVAFRKPVPLPTSVDVVRTAAGTGPVHAQVRRRDAAGTVCVDLRLAAADDARA